MRNFSSLFIVIKVADISMEDDPMMFFGDRSLLYYAVVLAILAVIVGYLGFGGLAGAMGQIAHILFFVFILLFVLSLIAHIVRKGPK